MENKEQYQLRQQLKNFLFPSQAEIFLYVFIGSLIIALINVGVIIDLLLDSSKVAQNIDYSIYLSDSYYELMQKSIAWFGNVIVWIFWGLSACTVYAIIWFVQNVILVAHDETEEADYTKSSDTLRTQNYNIVVGKPKSRYWKSAASKNIFFLSILLMYVGYILTYLFILLPLMSKLFLIGAYSLPDLRSIGIIISSFLANTLLIYSYILIQRVFVYSWRVIKPKEIV